MTVSRRLVRARWAVVAAWIALATLLILLPPPNTGGGGSFESLVPTDAEAINTRVRSAELFAAPLLTETVIVQRRADGLSDAAQQRVLDRAARVNARYLRGDAPIVDKTIGDSLTGFPELAFALPLINDRRVLPRSHEHSTTALTYLFFPPRYSLQTRARVARTFASELIDRPDDGLVGITGAAPARVEQVRLITGTLAWLHLATAALIGLVVGIHLRSLVAPLITLLAVGLSFLVAIRTVGWIGWWTGYALPQELEPLIVVLLLGVVTDYAIFYLAAYRSELSRRRDCRLAAVHATAGATPIVIVAALVVAASTATLVVSRLDFFRVLGPGLAITVLSGMLVSVTLMPALIASLGRVTLWPSRTEWAGVSGGKAPPFSPRHPARSRRTAAITLPAIALVLLAFGAASTRIDLGLPVIRDLPGDREPVRAAAAATTGIGAGVLSPNVLLLEQRALIGRQTALGKLQTRIEREPDVIGAIGPREQPAGLPVGAVFASDGSAARIVVILDASPTGADGIAAVRRLKARLPDLLAEAGLEDVRVSLGGNAALGLETVDAISDDLWRVALFAGGVNLLLLLLFLRGSIAAVALLIASALGLAAALGLTELTFVEALGHGELTYYVPFAAAVLLLSLGSDYTIFIAGRIWQQARERPLREAMQDVGREANGPVTAAGLALALSFALLALVPLRSFRELAFALAVGVMLDAFVVRTILVPAVINLLGERARWPGRPRIASVHTGGPLRAAYEDSVMICKAMLPVPPRALTRPPRSDHRRVPLALALVVAGVTAATLAAIGWSARGARRRRANGGHPNADDSC